ncbi:MAG: nicotinate (nicotinamide) nucleotide adenylyltransferase [Bacilli bacterium]
MEKIIIYGGSFDPIHNGHLRLARAASLRLNADVVFVPAKDPRWKKPEASALDRVNMLHLALDHDGSGAFSVDLCEMTRDGDVTYSIDTVKAFVKRYPKRGLYWLLGADEVNRFPEWESPEEIARLVQLVYVMRPGVEIDPDVVKKYGMIRLDYDLSGSVSSSAVRSLTSIDVPASVLDYIEKNNLYYMAKIEEFISGERLAHSLSVAHLALAIAQRNKILAPEKAYVAGLLHDLGKHLSEKENREIIGAHYPDYASYPAWCLHQFTGAYLAEKEFGIDDPAILDAIEFHCTGKAHMPPLSKIIYSSDKIDPSRGYDSTKMIDACLRNYYVGFLKVLKENEKFLKKEGRLESTPLSDECRDLYLGEGK